MKRMLVLLAVVTTAMANEKWVWQGNHRNHRAYDSSGGTKYGNDFYDREKDREPTTRRPSTSQPSDEDLISPDELRNFNPFGYPPAAPNNYPPGYVPPTGPSAAQSYPNANNGYPNGQPNYPTGPGALGYPPQAGTPGAYPVNGYQTQGVYPNQAAGQGYYPTGPFNGQQSGGYPTGFLGYPGFGNLFGFGSGFQGQGGLPGQNPVTGAIPNLSGNPTAQGAFPFPLGPYPTAGGAYPNQQGIPGQQGFPNQQQGYPNQLGQQGYLNQYPVGNYPQTGQFPVGQYNNCRQFGNPLCSGPQQGQYPIQYPSPGLYPVGQYPVPDPNNPYNANPYGITPYNRGSGYAAAFDDYDEKNKNSTISANRALKADGKSIRSSTPSHIENGHKKT